MKSASEKEFGDVYVLGTAVGEQRIKINVFILPYRVCLKGCSAPFLFQLCSPFISNN
jgi:hypothetical protein